MSTLTARLRRRGLSWFTRKPRDLTTHAARITVQPVEGFSGSVLRNVQPCYDVATEFESYGEQLAGITRADGSRASRSARVNRARADSAAKAAARTIGHHESGLEQALASHTSAHDDLIGFVRRAPSSRRRYEMTRWILLLGDTAGIWGAAIYMGELPLLAAGQAIAAGVAAVTAGQVGSDVRELRLSRQRTAMVKNGQISDAFSARYPRLFSPSEGDASTYGLALKVALLVVVSIAVSIFALRAAIEGPAGLVFGGLALATAAASFINSWSYADDVADVLAVYSQHLQGTLALHRQLAADPSIAAHAAATAQADSIEQEHELRAVSQIDQVRALQHEVYRRNPQVFGHGSTAAGSSPPAPYRELTNERASPLEVRPLRVHREAST